LNKQFDDLEKKYNEKLKEFEILKKDNDD